MVNATVLFGSAGIYLLGHVLFKYRVLKAWSRPRLIGMALVVVLAPAAALTAPLLALAGLVVLLGFVISLEHGRRRRQAALAASG